LVHDMPADTTPEGDYHMRTFYAQDRMAWETAGPCYDRGEEHLGVSDRGILMYRQMLREQLKAVEEGRDPQGTIRDPGQHQFIELPAWVTDFDAEKLREVGAEGPNVSSMAALFDERHESIELDPSVQVASRPG